MARVWSHKSVDSHKAAHHLFGVLRASGICKTDERAVDGDPGTPLELEHKNSNEQEQSENIYRPKQAIIFETLGGLAGLTISKEPRKSYNLHYPY